MQKTKKREKNDNLNKYREQLAIMNESLVKRAISHIMQLSGEVTYSAVSKVSYEIADIQTGEKGLTLAAVSKNPIYRSLVDQAKAGQSVKDTRPRGVGHYSQGDMGLMIHALRVENARIRQENKILSLKLKELPNVIERVEPISDAIIAKGNALMGIARSMVNRLCELEIAYIDTRTNSLVLAVFKDTILQEAALRLFYEKELNDIQSEVYKNAAYG